VLFGSQIDGFANGGRGCKDCVRQLVFGKEHEGITWLQNVSDTFSIGNEEFPVSKPERGAKVATQSLAIFFLSGQGVKTSEDSIVADEIQMSID
jgi:hypothetical protein